MAINIWLPDLTTVLTLYQSQHNAGRPSCHRVDSQSPRGSTFSLLPKVEGIFQGFPGRRWRKATPTRIRREVPAADMWWKGFPRVPGAALSKGNADTDTPGIPCRQQWQASLLSMRHGHARTVSPKSDTESKSGTGTGTGTGLGSGTGSKSGTGSEPGTQS